MDGASWSASLDDRRSYKASTDFGAAGKVASMNRLPPWTARVIIGNWIVIAMVLVGFVALYYDNKSTRECLTTYIEKDHGATQIRADFADEERISLGQVFIAITNSGKPEEARTAIFKHRDLLVKNDRLRQDNPYPPLPEGC
jgi:hypothetical protein